MKYCCKEFEICAKGSPGFEKKEDGTWSVIDSKEYTIIDGMKFCPFCGQSLRYTVKETEDGWYVLNGDKEALFFSTYKANAHKFLEECSQGKVVGSSPT